MDLSFYKLRVSDADLVLVDDLDSGGREGDWPKVARSVLSRRRGAGADRLVVLSRAKEAIWLRVWLPGGDRSPLQFDAALCAARYLLDSGRSGSDRVRLRVRGGELKVDILDGASLGLSLGPPLGLPGGETLDEAGAAARRSVLEAGGERYELFPLGLAECGEAEAEREEPGAESLRPAPAARCVAVLCDGGAREARARVGASARGEAPPPPLPLRVVARGELRVQAPRAACLDAASASALALVAACSAGYADRGAVVRLGDGALWVEWNDEGRLYAAARPAYAYRGEFHLDEAR